MKAHYLLKKNIDALLTARGHTRHDLAVWCRRGDSWISQIFTNADREVPLKYLDRMADFFGIATYQLFQPGISPLTERRKGADRRSGRDRRVSHLGQQIQATMTPVAANVTEADIADLLRLRTLTPESRVMLRKEMDVLARAEREAAARAGGRRRGVTAESAATGPAAPARRRSAGGTER